MANTEHSSSNQGTVKDPEHDGRLKENREAGRTKGTTEASAERAHGHETSHSSHASASKSEGSHSKSEASHGGDDLKSREYTDKDGNVHHHQKK